MPRKSSKTPRPVERRGYNVSEWCEAFGRSRATAYKLMGEGRLKYADVGGRRFIPNEAAEELLNTGESRT
jgi:predicted site-specific integrase-resolvase